MGARGAASAYLTRAGVARLFGVSPATVARWTRQGKLPFVLTLGGQRRYARDQIVDLLSRLAGALPRDPGQQAGYPPHHAR